MSGSFPDFDASLALAKKIHGHTCARLAIGTRLAIAGLKAVDLRDPKGDDRGNIMVFVEIDRCVTDAIMAVTGCRPGNRTMRIVDHGKVAATFFDLKTGRAVRVSVRDRTYDGPDDAALDVSLAESRLKPFTGLADRQLFRIREVAVLVPPEDIPGKLPWAAVCEKCGEFVLDMRYIRKAGRTLCKPCAKGMNYYREWRAQDHVIEMTG